MLLDFTVKIVNLEGKLVRTVTVSACDGEMAKTMAASFLLKENEFIGGF